MNASPLLRSTSLRDTLVCKGCVFKIKKTSINQPSFSLSLSLSLSLSIILQGSRLRREGGRIPTVRHSRRLKRAPA